MKSLIAITILFTICTSCYSQKASSEKMELGFSVTENDSLKKEIERFINKKTSWIELVEIIPKCETKRRAIFNDDETGIIGHKTVEECYFISIIKNSTKVNKGVVKLNEQYIGRKNKLKKADYLNLFKILYQKEIAEEEYSISSCYSPRHGISFYDQKNVLIGFLEICFECYGYKMAGEIPEYKTLLDTEFNELKKVFKEYNLLKI